MTSSGGLYRDNPILDEQVVTRDAVVAGLVAGCNETNENADLQVADCAGQRVA